MVLVKMLLELNSMPDDKEILTWENQDESVIPEHIKEYVLRENTEPETEAEEL
jgi:hypothetical protein